MTDPAGVEPTGLGEPPGPSIGRQRDVRFGWSAPTLLVSGTDRGR
jgi:hypothetical protein